MDLARSPRCRRRTLTAHLLAKSRYEEWLGAYRFVISEVHSVYGDPALGLEHTPEGGRKDRENEAQIQPR